MRAIALLVDMLDDWEEVATTSLQWGGGSEITTTLSGLAEDVDIHGNLREIASVAGVKYEYDTTPQGITVRWVVVSEPPLVLPPPTR